MSDPSRLLKFRDQKIEFRLASLLRWGVNISLALLVGAMLINFRTGQSWLAATDMNALLSGGANLRAEPPQNLAEFFYGFRHFQSLNFVQGAILVLILLPGFRVAFLMGSFARQRDWTFALISFVVLIIMSVGVLSMFAE